MKPDAQFLYPGWSDGAGWSNPDQFRTIVSGDIDGDGVGELIGRNGRTIELFTWAPPYPATDFGVGKAWNPLPGQWQQVFPASSPDFLTDDGWWDPSRYSTFRLADLDGQKGDELIARSAGGLFILRWDAANQTWSPPITTSVMADAQGWGQSHPDTYETITTGNVDGKPGDEIIGRGPDGIEAWRLDGSGLVRVDSSLPGNAILTNHMGWNYPEYYATIRTGDFDGDGVDELIARASDGLELFDLVAGVWTKSSHLLADWSDATNWVLATSYKTIAVGDFNGDGRDDVMGRSSQGIDARTFGPTGWTPLAPPFGFSDGPPDGFGDPENALTVQPADVLPATGTEVMGRADGAVFSYALQQGRWVLQPGIITQFSNANGWGTFSPSPKVSRRTGAPVDVRYSTIKPVTVEAGKPQVIIGRDATGVRTFQADGSSTSAGFAPYTDAGAPASPQTRAWAAINSTLAGLYSEFNGSTLVAQFDNLALANDWSALYLQMVSGYRGQGGNFDPNTVGTKAINAHRDDYNEVLHDAADWTNAVDNAFSDLLGIDSKRQLVTDTFIQNAATQVHDIETAIGATDGALLAFFAGIVGSLIGALSIFTGGLSDLAAAALGAVLGIVGSGVSGGIGFIDPNGPVETKADQLSDELRNAFCSANEFIANGFDQIVKDYGLLTVESATYTSVKHTAPDYIRLKSLMTQGQALWIWQQFGNMRSGDNVWIGWCNRNDTIATNCPLDPNTETTWRAPEDSAIVYQLVGAGHDGSVGNCEYSVFDNDANKGLRDLYFPPPGESAVGTLRAFISPRQTDTTQPGQPYGGGDWESGSIIPDNTGINGWNLGTIYCSIPPPP